MRVIAEVYPPHLMQLASVTCQRSQVRVNAEGAKGFESQINSAKQKGLKA